MLKLTATSTMAFMLFSNVLPALQPMAAKSTSSKRAKNTKSTEQIVIYQR